jgi:hypothetical protein
MLHVSSSSYDMHVSCSYIQGELVRRHDALARYHEFVMLRSTCGLIECGACARQRRRERGVNWGGAGRGASVGGTGAAGGASVGVMSVAPRGGWGVGRGGVLEGVGGVSATVIGLGTAAYITPSSIALSCPPDPCSRTRRAARELRYGCMALVVRGNRSLLLMGRSLLLIYCSQTRQRWVWRWYLCRI